jgi:hypothetical protein
MRRFRRPGTPLIQIGLAKSDRLGMADKRDKGQPQPGCKKGKFQHFGHIDWLHPDRMTPNRMPRDLKRV